MLVTAPAHNFDGTFIGVIALEIDMAPVYGLIQDTTGLGETGETLISTKMVSHDDIKGEHIMFLNPLRYDPDAAIKRVISIGGDKGIPIHEAASGKEGVGLTVDYRGEEVIARWRYKFMNRN
jgi:hypothetical protein